MSTAPALGILLTVFCIASAARSAAGEPDWIMRGREGIVAADHFEASQAGAAVLKSGGNAFDAAVATSLALAVCRPESTGLGGGGFMLAYVAATKQFVVLDFRETAPACASPERYAKLAGDRAKVTAAGKPEPWSPSVHGGNAVAVPGLVAGLAEINRRFGCRPWAGLFEPAIALAEHGFTVDETFRDACAGVVDDLAKWPDLKSLADGLATEILVDGALPAGGAKHKRPRLAAALRRIAADGSSAVYDGPIGTAIVAAVQAAGGGMTLDDLRAYRVKERMPLRARTTAETGDVEIITVPPPSSGGTALIEALNIAGVIANDFGKNFHNSEFYYPTLIGSLQHAFADRARWLGDPDFAAIPFPRLISREYAEKLSLRIVPERHEDYGSVDLVGTPASPAPPDDGGTSHFCIADRFGNIVSMTETINAGFGSYLVAEPFGIILNNEMDDFTTVAGQANLYGLTQSSLNLVAPGKRPLSSMTPTIIFRNSASGPRPFLAIGASGGPRIISNVLQVAQRLMNGQPLETAMTEPRLHHQWQPDEIYLDRDPPDDRWREIVKSLAQAGHKVSEKHRGASVQLILLSEDGVMTGACDPKKGGRPAGP